MSEVGRLSITMPNDVLADVRAAAGRANQSVSAWLTEAAADRLRREGMLELLAEYEAAHGEITEEQLAEIDQRTFIVGYGCAPIEEQMRARGLKWEKR
jgi:hypothetical protein